MFKYITAAAVVASLAHAEELESAIGYASGNSSLGVKAYTTTDCSGSAYFDVVLSSGTCVPISKTVNVAPLNNAMFQVLKLSPDAANEFYMFPNADACKSYGDKFNPAVEVAFIRAPNTGCVPCKDCGNVQSIDMNTASTTNSASATAKKDSAASTTIVSSAALIATTIFATLF